MTQRPSPNWWTFSYMMKNWWHNGLPGRSAIALKNTQNGLKLTCRNCSATSVKPGIHDAVKRNTVRALQTVPVPEELAGEAAELLSQYIADPREPLAVRCFSMTAFFNLGKNEPDLLEELRLVIEDILANETAGSLHARGKKVLKDIQNMAKKSLSA
jgi:hypothetical protein